LGKIINLGGSGYLEKFNNVINKIRNMHSHKSILDEELIKKRIVGLFYFLKYPSA
jgi:hypothetical protein